MYKGFIFILLSLSYYYNIFFCHLNWHTVPIMWLTTDHDNQQASIIIVFNYQSCSEIHLIQWVNAINPNGSQAKEELPCIIYQLTTQQSWAAVRETPSATCSCHSSPDFEVRQNSLILFYFPASLPAAAWRFDSVEHEGRCWWGRGKAVTPAGSASPRMAGLTCKGGGKGETRRSRPCLRKGWPGRFTGWQLLKACRLQSTRGGGGGSRRRRSGLRPVQEENSCACHLMMEKKGWAATLNGLLLSEGGASERCISVHPDCNTGSWRSRTRRFRQRLLVLAVAQKMTQGSLGFWCI